MYVHVWKFLQFLQKLEESQSLSVCRFGVIFVHSQVCPKSLKVLLPYGAYNTSNYYFQYWVFVV